MKKIDDLLQLCNGCRKKLIIMRNALIILMISTFQVLATGSYSQTTRLSLEMEGATIKEVLSKIEDESEFYFLYNSKLLNVEKKVNVSIKNKKVETVLNKLFDTNEVDFLFKDRHIVITPKDKSVDQQKSITGTVTDENGESLPGVTVMVKGTTSGTVTNIDGRFEIMVSGEVPVLLFSFVGMKAQEIEVNGRNQINVVLKSSSVDMDEVVVIGYGSLKKSDLTGSISSVKSDEFENQPVSSLAEALQGKASGVYVTKGSGAPGAGVDIIIRGASSINGLGPLYIVDGVKSGTGNNFNMSDVESIEILKDASSAAIYGVEAAGGVILVTTKKGKSGDKMHIDFNMYYGSRNAVGLPKLLNSEEYIRARKIMGVEYESWNQSPYDTDWMDELYSSATEQKYDLSISGGNEISTYYISSGYLKEEGILIENQFERYTLRINSDHKLAKNLTLGQTLYINKTKKNPNTTIQLPYRSIPMMDVYDDTRQGGWAAVPDGFQGGNKVGTAQSSVYNNNGWGMEGNFYIDWKIIDGLNLRASAGGYMGGYDNSRFRLKYDYGIIKNDVGKLQKSQSRNERMITNAVLTYDKTFGKHSVKAMAGWEAQKSNYSSVSGRTEGFPVEYTPSFNLSTQSATDRYARGWYSEATQLAQFGRLNYNYNGKYLLQATVRRDGTNKFIDDNRWGVFPSVSGAWKISEESFFKDNVNWIDLLKLRAGWGILGSTGAVGSFLYQTTYSTINVHSFDGSTAVTGWGVSKFPNTDIRWEEVTSTNIGFDLGMFNNRFSFSADFYDKQTTDMIYKVSLPPSAGLGQHNLGGFGATINIGKISNRGFEFETGWADNVGKLNYSVSANASFNKNKVIQIGEEGSYIYEGGATWMNGSISRTEDGLPMGQFYGYIADGIFQTDAEAQASAQPDARAGDLIYRDINGKDENGDLSGKPDNKIDDADKTQLGNPWPKCFYGLNINVEYKGFDLRAFFQGQAGVELFNTTKGIRQSFYADWNTTSEIFNTSKFGNDNITSLPSTYQVNDAGEILRDPNGNYKNVSSYFIENGSYLKLKDLQIGYTLPQHISSVALLSNARIYISGSNLFTITKYTGIDPELGGGVRSRGIETEYLYPKTRFISVGLNLKF